jgi:O-succinylbenzoate synthase
LADADRLRALDELNLTMLEQPLAWNDLRDHARLQARIQTPICLDESIRSVKDVLVALDLDACRIVNVKPGRVGGLANAVAIHDVCLERRIPAWVGGMLESGIGRAHNVALASLPGFTLPGDLSESRRFWARDLVTPEFDLVDGRLAVPTGVGIGVVPDLERIEALTVRRAVFPS